MAKKPTRKLSKADRKQAADVWINNRSRVVWVSMMAVILAIVGQLSSSSSSSPSRSSVLIANELLNVTQGCDLSVYGKSSSATSCRPQFCSRMYIPNFLSSAEVQNLLDLAQSGMNASPGGSGPPTIMDMHSGAISYGDKFVHIKSLGISLPEDLKDTYRSVVVKVKNEILKHHKGVAPESLYLTSPSFFSRINGSKVARTVHDEYWHDHVDQIQYGSFVYTALLYLADHQVDFEGGRFIFRDGANEGNSDSSRGEVDTTILEPSKGMLCWFTSGPENVHRVEQVTKGLRYALTIAFTCDPKASIEV